MADQMTPAEMRERADRLRRIARELAAGETVPIWDEDVVPGADALDRLADVIEYAERQMGPPAADWEHDPAKILQTVARIARGENFPDFSERG